jgi:hypothetical protein
VLLRHTNVRIQILLLRVGVLLNLLNLLVDPLTNILLNGLQLFFGCPLLLQNHIPANLDRITSLPHILYLVLGAVGDTRIRHRVTVISISIKLQEKRPILLNVSTCPLHDFLDLEHILSIDIHARDQITPCVEFIIVRGSLL